MTTTKTCPVCAKALDASRVARYPSARTCGAPICGAEHRRLRMNFNRNKYVKKRRRDDPEFRQRKNQRQREKYAEERLLLRKIAAHRAPVANARGLIDTFLQAANRIALGVFRLVGLRFQA